MKIERVRKMTPLNRFIYWVRERQSIFEEKSNYGGGPPWSDDEIFQTTYFTNVRREDDKVTRWLKENIRDPLQDKPEVFFAVFLFRWFNLPYTGEQLLKIPTPTKFGAFTDWKPKPVMSRLHGLHEHGAKVFTGAYIIPSGGNRGSKITTVCEQYITPVWQKRQMFEEFFSMNNFHASHKCRLGDAHKLLKDKCPGLGSFMAAQVLADLKYTALFSGAPDWQTWCAMGPGSVKGLNIVNGYDVGSRWKPDEFVAAINKLQQILLKRVSLNLHAQDVQNCCCEFSKYDRILNGGRSKRKYQGK